jgi:hypothetical protein
MNIHDTDKLVLTFKDAPPSVSQSVGFAGSPNPASSVGRLTSAEKPSVAAPPAIAAGAPSTAGASPEVAKPARPIDLSAHRVEARILRQVGGKNDLDRLWTEGQVRVRQAPEKPDEQGLDIKGETLELIKQPEGNRLVVTGDVAELQIDKLFIRGPQVEIDQADNEAWVKGVGALTMKTKTSFNGNPLDHEVDMTIYWSEYMHFKGSHAQFTGSIQAEQENAQLACQSLQVDLDRPISFREGQKNGPPAKVDRMVCDRSVMVQDSEFLNGKCVKYQRIECRELIVDNTEGKAHGTGPGTVRIHQRGDAATPLAPAPAQGTPARPASPAKDQEMKLTIIHFGGRMWADNKSHTAIFSDSIEVINMPTENQDLQPDLDKLPRGAVYLTCSDQLKVYNRPENGKSNQELEGTGNVRCTSEEYIAQCEKVTYHEGKDQLIFDGGDGWAHLRKLGPPGGPPQQSDAKQFIYLRKTGQIQSIKSRGVSGTTAP